MTLSPGELREITRKTRCDAQARVLKHMGVPFTERPDGSLAVARVAVEMALGVRPGTIERPEPQLQP